MTAAAAEGPSRAPLTDRGRRTRDALVTAARTVFEERGFNATRMGDIAEAAGVSHGTVYTWFDTKESLLYAVVDGVVGDLYEALTVPDVADPVQRVARANRAYLDAYRANARLLEVTTRVAQARSRRRLGRRAAQRAAAPVSGGRQARR